MKKNKKPNIFTVEACVAVGITSLLGYALYLGYGGDNRMVDDGKYNVDRACSSSVDGKEIIETIPAGVKHPSRSPDGFVTFVVQEKGDGKGVEYIHMDTKGFDKDKVALGVKEVKQYFNEKCSGQSNP